MLSYLSCQFPSCAMPWCHGHVSVCIYYEFIGQGSMIPYKGSIHQDVTNTVMPHLSPWSWVNSLLWVLSYNIQASHAVDCHKSQTNNAMQERGEGKMARFVIWLYFKVDLFECLFLLCYCNFFIWKVAKKRDASERCEWVQEHVIIQDQRVIDIEKQFTKMHASASLFLKHFPSGCCFNFKLNNFWFWWDNSPLSFYCTRK